MKIGMPVETKECNCFAVRSAARHVTQFYDQFLAPVGLRTTQFSILVRLKRMGPLTINALANERKRGNFNPPTQDSREAQLAIAPLQLVLINRAFGARYSPDLQKPQLHASAPVAQLGSDCARDLCDLAHDTGQYANAVPKQGLGWMMDVALNHCRINAHPSSRGHALVARFSRSARESA
jgi:hypothetical protein